ncbi:hypothetical protein [Variovorax boronicumulans]|uniref:hypothetical protein n=1 Tax=Variovorax boronicumulans TaxID=436515 RepID=UPI001C57BC52
MQSGFVTIGEALPHTKSGCVKPLGVFGTGRMPLAPQISTFTKHGFKGHEHRRSAAYLRRRLRRKR